LIEFAAEFVDDFLDEGAGGFFGFGGEDVFKGEEFGDEMNVGLDGVEEFGFDFKSILFFSIITTENFWNAHASHPGRYARTMILKKIGRSAPEFRELKT
jgi:hypothetical protein